MIKAILFDCFGVLVGTGFEYTYRVAGGDPVRDRKFIEDILGRENLGLITSAEFERSLIRQLSITADGWQRAVDQAEQPDLELLDYIEQLRKTYKTAVLSNANLGVVEARIGATRLKECFDEVVVSAEIGLVKPDPAIFHYAAEQLGIAPDECVLVDDRSINLQAAAKLGMRTILYKGFAGAKTELEHQLADTKR